MQTGAKAELETVAHNSASGFCTASVQKSETEAKPAESFHVCRGFPVPLANEAMEQLEVREELVGMQGRAVGALPCPQGDQTPKAFSHTAAVQQVVSAELASEQS